MPLPDLANARREPQDLGEVLFRELGYTTAEVVGFEVIYRADLTSEEPATEGRVADDLGAAGSGSLDKIERGFLNVEIDWRVLDLNGSDMVHGVGTVKTRCGAVGKA